MTSPSEHVIDRLNEQLSAVIDGGLAQHVELDAANPSEKALERRINAVIDAARAQAIELEGTERPSLETQKLGWVLDSLVENAPVMIFLKSAADLTLELWNKRAEQLSGVRADEILGKTGLESFPSEEMRAFHQRDRSVLDGKRLVATEEALTGPQGDTRWIYTQKIPLLDATGEPRYLLGISEDVTERRLATEELRRAKDAAELANHAKTDFLANVSHELRTPLTLILGPIADTLADGDEPLPPRLRESLEKVHRSSLRLLKLVNTLLDFTRVEAGRMHASFEPHDLGALTVDLASNFRSAIERAGLRLVVSAPPSPDVYVDEEMWAKIVLNLLSNALKFTFEGEIRVSLRANPDQVILEVKDTGTGIPEDELPRIFERFRRVRAARSRTHEGTGIGLALVQELVHLHGGTIRAESQVGEGTTVTVTIPRGAAHRSAEPVKTARNPGSRAPFVEEALRWLPSPADPPAPAPDAGPRARILVADDNADMRSYLVSLLGRTWDVQAVADGAAALLAARRAPPDLVLSDVMMPGLDGAELLRALRGDERTRSIPMILISARAGEEATIEGWEAGADDYLVKPFSARELVARVRTTLALARLRRDVEEKQQARAAAEESNRIKDEFLATVSHELRTPLTAIMGWASVLSGPLPDAATLAKGLAVIERNAAAQKTIIDDILDLSRIITGHLRIELAPIDLRGVVADAIDVVMPSAIAKEIGVAYRGPRDPCPVVGDPQRLRQIVWNILSNAVKFTPARGRVDVRLERARGKAMLLVEDSGEGITPDLLPHVFDRFRQADSSTTRRHAGLGLGLSIVRQLVELHGGRASAASPGKGLGATFTVELPLRALATDRAVPGGDAREQRADSPLARMRVLVVDDEEDARDFLELCLASSGAIVATVGSADEAVRALARFHPDVLVSDIGMPGEDGLSLIRRVRAAPDERSVPAIALSAYAHPDDAARAISAGFTRYLAKPIDAAALVRAVLDLRAA